MFIQIHETSSAALMSVKAAEQGGRSVTAVQGLTMIRLSTFATPGATQAALSAVN
jgi:hypothetical protein